MLRFSHTLATLGEYVKDGFIKGANLALDTLLANGGTKNLYVGQVEASRLSLDFIKHFRNSVEHMEKICL